MTNQQQHQEATNQLKTIKAEIKAMANGKRETHVFRKHRRPYVQPP
jgi:hypothetical protein